MSLSAQPDVLRANARSFTASIHHCEDGARHLRRIASSAGTLDVADPVAAALCSVSDVAGPISEALKLTAEAVENADHSEAKQIAALAVLAPVLGLSPPRHGGSVSLHGNRLVDDFETLDPLKRLLVAAAWPVDVLEASLDRQFDISDAELDVMIISLASFPPDGAPPHNPGLQQQLDEVSDIDYVPMPGPLPNIPIPDIDVPGIDLPALPPLNRVDVALSRTQVLVDAGSAGQDYRDAINAPVTYLAMAVGLRFGGDSATASRGPDGLIVVEVDRQEAGIPINLALAELIPDVPRLPIAGGGGTTYGNTFVYPRKARDIGDPIDTNLLKHELRHTFQWAAAGLVEFPILYGAESAKSAVLEMEEIELRPGMPPHFETDCGCSNRFEEDAGLLDGGYICT